MRLFIAAYPPQEALDDLDAMVHDLGIARFAAEQEVNVRITARELWHVTLAFIGETSDERLDDARTALESVSSRRADLWIGGGGKFGRGRFTIMWAGLRGETDALAVSAAQVRTRLKKARLPYDRKPFRPHMTIARPGDRVPTAIVAADIIELNEYDGPEWTFDEICLVASHQGPKPVHEIVHRA